jgi:hypothetical protein
VVTASLGAARQVQAQDVEESPTASVRLRRGWLRSGSSSSRTPAYAWPEEQAPANRWLSATGDGRPGHRAGASHGYHPRQYFKGCGDPDDHGRSRAAGGQLVELHIERSYLSRACWSGSGWQSWRSAVRPGLYTMGDASRKWPAQENLFDVRLAAAIYNLHVITRVVAATQDLAA